MKISPVSYLNFCKINKTQKQGATKPSFEVQNRDLAFGMAKISDVQKAQIEQSLKQKRFDEAIVELTDRSNKSKALTQKAIAILDEIPYDEFLKLVNESKFGDKKDRNLLEASSKLGAEYIVDRLKLEDLKEFLKGDISKILYTTENHFVCLNDAFDVILAKMGSEEIAKFYTSRNEVDENGKPVTYLDSILQKDPRVLRRIIKNCKSSDVEKLVKSSYSSLVETKHKDMIFEIICKHISNYLLSFSLYKDGDLIDPFYTNKLRFALQNFSSKDVAKLIQESEHKAFAMKVIERDKECGYGANSSNFSLLLKRLTPKKYPDVYSGIGYMGPWSTQATCLSALAKYGQFDLAIENFPNELLIELLEKDYYFCQVDSWDIQNKIADKLGKKAYNSMNTYKKHDYDHTKSRIFWQNLESKNAKEKLESAEFKALKPVYKAEIIAACYTYDYFSDNNYSDNILDLTLDLATNCEEVSLEDSIKLLEGYIKIMHKKDEDKCEYAQKMLEILKTQQAQNS